MSTGAGSSRAGVWRRVAAMLIDALLITAILAVSGLLLFAPTGGAIRVTNALINSQSCEDVGVSNLGDLKSVLPGDFRATEAQRCTRRFFGYIHDRFLTVSEVTESGSVSYRRKFSVPADSAWRPTDAANLDDLFLPLFALYLVGTQWRFGWTPGMRVLGVGVRSLSGESVGLIQVIKRIVALLAPVILVAVSAWLSLRYGSTNVWVTTVAVAWLTVAGWVLNFVLAVRSRGLPWHDRVAGTEVMRQR